MASIAGKTKERIVQEEPHLKSPWSVNTIRDLWVFFGPLLTFLIVIQVFYSFKLAQLLEKHGVLHEGLPANLAAVIIALVSLATSSLVLKGCKGQEYKNFNLRLLGIGITSSVIAAAVAFALEFL